MRNLIVSMAIILLVLPSCKFVKEKGWFGAGNADTLVVWQANQNSIRVADSIQAELNMIKAAEKKKVDSLRLIEEARLEVESRFKYHIVVGSFLTPEFADDHLALYRSMGYDATIIDGPDARFKFVSAEVHESVSKALNRLVCYQDTVEFEAWLYTRN